jgi:predicted N-acyltransferase
MHEARIHRSIHEIGKWRWDACFPGAVEGFDYLAAVEAAGLPGFDWRYVTVSRDGEILACAPGFITDYSLDTTLTSFGRSLVAATRRLAPRAFTLRLASLGSPCTEDVSVGFSPGLPREARSLVLARLISAFEAEAAGAGCGLLAVKDAPSGLRDAWRQPLQVAGYLPQPGLPTAVLDLPFDDLDGYLASLSHATRKDLRRKLKVLPRLRIEVRHDLGGCEPRILELYRQTRARADMQFEDLTLAYFEGVLQRMGERALSVLYFEGDELVGYNLLLQDHGTLLDKFFCSDTVRGPELNLYFVSWVTNVRLALERGLDRYQSGQGAYETKLRLGSRLIGADMHFRHRRPLVNRALQWAAPFLADDPVAA